MFSAHRHREWDEDETDVTDPAERHSRARRAARWRDLLKPGRSQGADRGLGAALRHDPPAQQPWLSTASPGNRNATIAAFRFRFAPPTAGNGEGGHNALTVYPDHSMGGDRHSVPKFVLESIFGTHYIRSLRRFFISGSAIGYLADAHAHLKPRLRRL